jgi:hypothetical protein
MNFVRNNWLRIRKFYPTITPRQSPHCNEYDVHLNVTISSHVHVSEVNG